MTRFINKNFTMLLLFFIMLGFPNIRVLSQSSQLPTQTGITFSETTFENNFPNDLSFTVTVESDAGEIISAKLYYVLRNDISTTQQILSLDPAKKVSLSFTWDTSNITVPPSTPVYYFWEVTDSSGNMVRSEKALVYYDDIRFDWQIEEDENIAVWWHDRPLEFGNRVFAIAQRAFSEQYVLFQADLDFQIRIIIYNEFDEFAAWHSFINEFIGGQAFPGLGITTQIVSAYSSEEVWLNDVIPHEISHLYLFQASYHPLADIPAWLNEGVAQYNEFTSNDFALSHAQDAIEGGQLLPLWSLSGSFGNDEDDVRLAYAESLSAVIFLVEAYGEHGLANLLAAYKSGLSGDKALQSTFGRTLIEFQQDWLAWLGIPDDMYPTPTPRPTLSIPTAPSMMVPPTKLSADHSTSPTPTLQSTAVTPTTPSSPTPTPKSGIYICLSSLFPALLFTLVILPARRYRKK
jgi:hypothetical protein